MLSFLTRHASRVKGVLRGFDRVRFLRGLCVSVVKPVLVSQKTVPPG
jgi:hypothetical protein